MKWASGSGFRPLGIGGPGLSSGAKGRGFRSLGLGAWDFEGGSALEFY